MQKRTIKIYAVPKYITADDGTKVYIGDPVMDKPHKTDYKDVLLKVFGLASVIEAVALVMIYIF